MVAVLLRPHAKPGGTDRRAGRAGRPHRRRRRGPGEPVGGAPVRFPPQEHRFSAGDTAFDSETNGSWTIRAVDDAAGTIDLKIGSTYSGQLPAALVEAGPPGTKNQRERLRDLGDRVVREGVGGEDAATALLLRRPPDDGSVTPGSLRAEDETASAAAIRFAVSLRGSYLPMQGPPGTGKTYTAAEQILELIAQGRTACVTGPSHAVIHHLIDAVQEHARCRGARVPRIGTGGRRNPYRHPDATMMSPKSSSRPCGTASWTWPRARPGCGRSRGWRPAWNVVRGRGGAAVAGQRAGGGGGARTWCCWATRSSSPSRATPPTRPARAPRRSSTSWATGRPCPRALLLLDQT